jgi:hypothetical protein
MVAISLMTPLGGVLGMLVQNAPIDGYARDIVILICQGLAVGTFIYVSHFINQFLRLSTKIILGYIF